MAGLLRALSWNLDRRQGSIRLFEVGNVFSPPDPAHPRTVRAGSGGAQQAALPVERELVSAVFAADGDDARTAVTALLALADDLRLVEVRLRAPEGGFPLPGLHPTRSAEVRAGADGRVVGTVGEIDPAVASDFGVDGQRIGWMELDLGLVLDHAVVGPGERPGPAGQPVPVVRRGSCLRRWRRRPRRPGGRRAVGAGGELLESVTLFDVYRGPGVERSA